MMMIIKPILTTKDMTLEKKTNLISFSCKTGNFVEGFGKIKKIVYCILRIECHGRVNKTIKSHVSS